MGVRIPRLQKFQTSSAIPKNPRINVQVQDQSQQYLQTNKAINSLVAEGVDAYYRVEDKKINAAVYKAENDYNTWYAEKSNEVKKITADDPTEAYKNLDEEAKKKYDEIIASHSNMSTRAQNAIKNKLKRSADALYLSSLNQRKVQTDTYEKNVYDSNLSLKSNNLVNSAGTVRASGESAFDEHIRDIKNTIAERYKDNGGVEVLDPKATNWDHKFIDNDGKEIKVNFKPISKAQVQQQLDKGVTESVNAALDAGQKDQAMLIYNRYKDNMSAKNQAEFLKKYKAAGKDDTAKQEAARIMRLPENERVAAIEKIKDDEVRPKTLQLVKDSTTRIEYFRTLKQNKNYEVGYKKIKQMIKDGQIHGITDVESNTALSGLYRNFSPKQQKSIDELFNPPEKTTKESITKMQNLILGNNPKYDITKMKPEEFEEFKVGMNATDRRHYDGIYEKINTSKMTSSEKRTIFDRAKKQLEEQLLIDEHISVKDKYGHYSESDQIELMKANKEMIGYLSDYIASGPAPTDKELNSFLEKYSRARIDEKVFIPPKRINKTGENRNISDYDLNRTQLFQMKRKYMEKYGKTPTANSIEFLDFLDSEKVNKK